MEGKLLKINNIYTLMVNDKMIASDDKDFQIDYEIKKLSLKNCEAVANGYDLEELACDRIGIDISVVKHIDRKVIEKNESTTTPIHEAGALGASLYHTVKGFEIGFQKALELLGDNKELIIKLNDLLDGLNSFKYQVKASYLHFDCEEIIKSLQQTEWNVEIVMECVIGCENLIINGENSLCCGNKKPKLDTDGCLILKIK